MKPLNVSLISIILALMLGMMSDTAVADSTKQAQIGELVRVLGYGGAIHNFKNFVIRGEEEYASKARQHYTHAGEIVASLKNTDPSAEENTALDNIEQMITAYLGVIDTVEEHYAHSSHTLLENESIRVDDGPALTALAALRAGMQWSEFEEIEYALGYGGAIHEYKNFVMHGQDKEQENAGKGFEHALALSESLAKAELNEQESGAVADIQKVIKDYQKNLKKIEKTAKYIQKTKDRSVKRMAIHQADKHGNDEPALKGFAVLREKYAHYAN